MTPESLSSLPTCTLPVPRGRETHHLLRGWVGKSRTPDVDTNSRTVPRASQKGRSRGRRTSGTPSLVPPLLPCHWDGDGLLIISTVTTRLLVRGLGRAGRLVQSRPRPEGPRGEGRNDDDVNLGLFPSLGPSPFLLPYPLFSQSRREHDS